jgi:hypothetical protein
MFGFRVSVPAYVDRRRERRALRQPAGVICFRAMLFGSSAAEVLKHGLEPGRRDGFVTYDELRGPDLDAARWSAARLPLPWVSRYGRCLIERSAGRNSSKVCA